MTAQAKRETVIPQETIAVINRFRDLIDDVRKAPTKAHVSARMKALYRTGAELHAHSDRLVARMEQGERWFKAHAAHPQYAEREDQWIGWLKEYEAVQDALADAKDLL